MVPGRTELHFHLLPGVDDGPPTTRAAVRLARAAVADGTTTVVCTSHARFLDAMAEARLRVAALREALDRAGVGLELHAGAELSPPDVADLGRADLEQVAHGPPGARWVLLEAPLEPGQLELLHAAAGDLARRGFGILLAHPERCPALMAPDGGLHELRHAGARLQVNASSLLGRHGEAARVTGLALVRAGHAAVIASDAHGDDRPPCLRLALGALARAGVAHPETLVTRTPSLLLRDGIAPLAAAAASATR